METIFNHPGLFLTLILVALAIDLIAGLTWWRDYFRVGIPLLVRKQPFAQANPTLPHSDALANRFCNGLTSPLLFHALSPTEIAVRESFWAGFFRFTYTPLVHGLLEVDPNAREIRIVGRANAFPLVFIFAFAIPLTFQMRAHDLFGVVFLVLLVGSLYATQYVRYGKVLKETVNLLDQT